MALFGTHYYPWYSKTNWGERTIRLYLEQGPSVTKQPWYNNYLNFPLTDPVKEKVVRQHFEWCKEAGIDFVLISFKKQEMLPYLEIAAEVGIKACLQVETLALAGNERVTSENIGRVLFSLPRIRDWLNHPAWLRIKERPVLAYYVTRQIRKDCLQEFVSSVRAALGNVYLLGDEVWWNQPEKERLKHFDGIYAYNMYINKGDRMDKGKVISQGEIGLDYLNLIKPYEEAFFKKTRELDIDFLPTVLPGYNDRAVRYDADHYAIPRNNGEFFQHYLEYSKQFMEDQILLVTSFNEWYEDTQIEPCITLRKQKVDTPQGKDFVQGLDFEAYDKTYLQILKDFKRTTNLARPVESLKQVIDSSSSEANELSSDELLDYCALLYYQTTILPILSSDNAKKLSIQKKYYEYTEEAHRRKITVKQIKMRAKELTQYFTENRSELTRRRKDPTLNS